MNRAFLARLRAWQVDAAGAASMAAILFMFYVLMVSPALKRRAMAEMQTDQLATQRDTLARVRAARQDADVKLALVQESVAHQRVQLEPRAQVNQRLARLTVLADDCGVEVERLSPGATADGSRHGTMTLRFSGRAPYQACESFIAGLHQRFNDTALTMLRLASSPESEGPVTMEIELLWFTAPDLKASAQK